MEPDELAAEQEVVLIVGDPDIIHDDGTITLGTKEVFSSDEDSEVV